MPGTCATEPMAAPTMTKVAAEIERRKFIPSSMNQNCRTMTIQTRMECAMTNPKLRPRSRNDKPSEKLFNNEASRAMGTYRTMRSTFARKKNKKSIAATDPATITQAVFFISITVCPAAAGSLTTNNAHPNSAMIISVSRKRSTMMVATDAVSGICSHRVSQSGRTTSPARPIRYMAENPKTFVLINGPTRMDFKGFSKTFHRKARTTYVSNVAAMEAISQPG